MTRVLRCLIALALLASAAPAGAAEPLPPQDRPEAFQKLDTDKDGFISRQEAAVQPEVAANFDKADRNRDPMQRSGRGSGALLHERAGVAPSSPSVGALR